MQKLISSLCLVGVEESLFTPLSISPLWSERHPHLLKQNLLSPAMWQDPCLPLQSYTIIALIMSWFANNLCSRIPEGADSKCSLLASKPELPNHSLEDCACGMCSNKFHSWVSSILKFKNKALDQRAYRGHSLWKCIWGNHPLVSEEEKGNAWEVMKRELWGRVDRAGIILFRQEIVMKLPAKHSHSPKVSCGIW